MSREDDAPNPGADGDEDGAEGKGRDEATALQGTTLRVYRFLFKQGKPVRIHDIQKGLDLSSPSVAQYQIAKLLRAGLVRETEEGYVVDRVVLGNLIRVGSTVLPYQITYTVFFAAALTILLTILKPAGPPTSTFVFSVAVVWVGFAVSFFESWKMLLAI